MPKEKIQVTMEPVHPGEFVREEILNALNLTIAKAAKILDVRAATLSDFVNEKSSLSAEMAMRLELAFDLKTELMLRMQALYDSMSIRQRAAEFNVSRYEGLDC